MSALPRLRLTPDAYLDWEEQQPEKHAYYDGKVFPLEAGTAEHALVIGNLLMALRKRLHPRGCVVFSGALRVLVSERGLYTYPDLSVVCGLPTFADDRRTTLTNPLVLVEVLSPSTRAYDEGAKLDFYLALASLRAYVVVDTEEPSARTVWRDGDRDDWRLTHAHGLDATLSVPPLDGALTLAEVFEGVTFPERPFRDVRTV